MYTGFTEEFRRRSREYFGYRCVFCGCDTIRYDRLQPVHHVHYNDDHVMDELDNLSCEGR